MLGIPQRRSMVEQVVEALRGALGEGRWERYLPSERRLVVELQVSRPTVRRALEELAREGVIAIRQGRRTEILEKPREPAQRVSVAFIVLRSVRHAIGALVLRECETALQRAGFRTEWYEEPYAHSRERLALLRHLLEARRGVIWLVVSAEPDEQKLFEAPGVRAILFGSAHEGVSLPAVDLDYAAVGRHALGTFHRLGYRQVHAILPHKALAGDRRTAAGLLEASRELPGIAYRPSWLEEESPEALARLIRRQLAQAHPPCGWFCTHHHHAVQLLTTLLAKGGWQPGRFALLSRDDGLALAYTTPPIAAYRADYGLEVRKVVRLVQGLASHYTPPPGPTLFFPGFEARGTMVPATVSSP